MWSVATHEADCAAERSADDTAGIRVWALAGRSLERLLRCKRSLRRRRSDHCFLARQLAEAGRSKRRISHFGPKPSTVRPRLLIPCHKRHCLLEAERAKLQQQLIELETEAVRKLPYRLSGI